MIFFRESWSFCVNSFLFHSWWRKPIGFHLTIRPWDFCVWVFMLLRYVIRAAKNCSSWRRPRVPPQLNVTEAARFCRSRSMQLVSLETAAEERRLVRLITGADLANPTAAAATATSIWWTSGSDAATEGRWLWTATGRPFVHTNWAAGQPDNSGAVEHFVAVTVTGFTSAWFDLPPFASTSSVCEFQWTKNHGRCYGHGRPMLFCFVSRKSAGFPPSVSNSSRTIVDAILLLLKSIFIQG